MISKPPVASRTISDGGKVSQLEQKLIQAFAITGDGESSARWANMHIETILRDIDADEVERRGRLFHDPSLRMRARPAAQATVRVPCGTGGRGTMLNHGLDARGAAGSRPPIASPASLGRQRKIQGGPASIRMAMMQGRKSRARSGISLSIQPAC